MDEPMSANIVADTTRTLDRIEEANGRLKAFVTVLRHTAPAEAGLVEARRASGDTARPLDGMPIAVKDIIDVAGVVSGCGSLTRRNAPPAARDAPAAGQDGFRIAGSNQSRRSRYAAGLLGVSRNTDQPVTPSSILPAMCYRSAWVAKPATLQPLRARAETLPRNALTRCA